MSPGLRQPWGNAPSTPQRSRLHEITQFDPSWGSVATPPQVIEDGLLRWNARRKVYDIAPGVHARFGSPQQRAHNEIRQLAKAGRHLQAYMDDADPGRWQYRWVQVPTPLPDARQPYTVIGGTDSQPIGASNRELEEREAEFQRQRDEAFRQTSLGRALTGEGSVDELLQLPMESLYGPPTKPRPLGDYAWVAQRDLPRGCPYPYPWLPVPQPDYESGRWLDADYVPSYPLPYPFNETPWQCGVPRFPGEGRGKGSPKPPGPPASPTPQVVVPAMRPPHGEEPSRPATPPGGAPPEREYAPQAPSAPPPPPPPPGESRGERDGDSTETTRGPGAARMIEEVFARREAAGVPTAPPLFLAQIEPPKLVDKYDDQYDRYDEETERALEKDPKVKKAVDDLIKRDNELYDAIQREAEEREKLNEGKGSKAKYDKALAAAQKAQRKRNAAMKALNNARAAGARRYNSAKVADLRRRRKRLENKKRHTANPDRKARIDAEIGQLNNGIDQAQSNLQIASYGQLTSAQVKELYGGRGDRAIEGDDDPDVRENLEGLRELQELAKFALLTINDPDSSVDAVLAARAQYANLLAQIDEATHALWRSRDEAVPRRDQERVRSSRAALAELRREKAKLEYKRRTTWGEKRRADLQGEIQSVDRRIGLVEQQLRHLGVLEHWVEANVSDALPNPGGAAAFKGLPPLVPRLPSLPAVGSPAIAPAAIPLAQPVLKLEEAAVLPPDAQQLGRARNRVIEAIQETSDKARVNQLVDDLAEIDRRLGLMGVGRYAPASRQMRAPDGTQRTPGPPGVPSELGGLARQLLAERRVGDAFRERIAEEETNLDEARAQLQETMHRIAQIEGRRTLTAGHEAELARLRREKERLQNEILIRIRAISSLEATLSSFERELQQLRDERRRTGRPVGKERSLIEKKYEAKLGIIDRTLEANLGTTGARRAELDAEIRELETDVADAERAGAEARIEYAEQRKRDRREEPRRLPTVVPEGGGDPIPDFQRLDETSDPCERAWLEASQLLASLNEAATAISDASSALEQAAAAAPRLEDRLKGRAADARHVRRQRPRGAAQHKGLFNPNEGGFPIQSVQRAAKARWATPIAQRIGSARQSLLGIELDSRSALERGRNVGDCDRLLEDLETLRTKSALLTRAAQLYSVHASLEIVAQESLRIFGPSGAYGRHGVSMYDNLTADAHRISLELDRMLHPGFEAALLDDDPAAHLALDPNGLVQQEITKSLGDIERALTFSKELNELVSSAYSILLGGLEAWGLFLDVRLAAGHVYASKPPVTANPWDFKLGGPRPVSPTPPTKSGVTVLGSARRHWAVEARATGARHFRVSQTKWRALTGEQRTALLRNFIRETAARRERVVFLQPLKKARPTAWVRKEVKWLEELGYVRTRNGMNPPP